MTLDLKIVSASFHRNGVFGSGFYAILFDDAEQGRMIASLFDAPGHCAVFLVSELAKDNVLFAQGNSWRGDDYERELRPLLDAYLAKRGGGNRRGPFAVPEGEPK